MVRHLIHIGYPKAGSTFLERWFHQHPQLAFTPGGLAGVRDVYALSRAAALPADGRIRYRVTSYEGLAAPWLSVGDPRLPYDGGGLSAAVRQKQACDLLAGLFEGASILIVTRGFRAMLLSSYSQYLRSGGDAPFETLVAHALRSRGEDDHPIVSVEHWQYDRLIRDYREAFGQERVVVLPFELLRDDPTLFLGALCERLGVDPAPVDPTPVNTALSPEELAWYPRLSRRARALPQPLFRLYLRGVSSGRLKPLALLLQRFRTLRPVTQEALPQDVLEGFRGCADVLRTEPLFARYSEDYLL